MGSRHARGARVDDAIDSEGRAELVSDLVDVPAAVVCATCGDALCPGCADVEEPTHGSGVVAIVPWERGDGTLLSRFWRTAKLCTRESEPFFAALPEGDRMGAFKFALLAELFAVTGLCVLGLILGVLVAPGWLTLAFVENDAFRELVLRGLGWGVPALSAVMVTLHVVHGVALDWAARRAQSTRKGRGWRFGLYACGWDLVTLPFGLLTLAVDEGIGAALRTAPLALSVPSRASLAYLRGIHRLDEVSARVAARRAVRVSALLVLGFIALGAFTGLLVAVV